MLQELINRECGIKRDEMKRIFQKMKVNRQSLLVGAGRHRKQISEDWQKMRISKVCITDTHRYTNTLISTKSQCNLNLPHKDWTQWAKYFQRYEISDAKLCLSPWSISLICRNWLMKSVNTVALLHYKKCCSFFVVFCLFVFLSSQREPLARPFRSGICLNEKWQTGLSVLETCLEMKLKSLFMQIHFILQNDICLRMWWWMKKPGLIWWSVFFKSHYRCLYATSGHFLWTILCFCRPGLTPDVWFSY